MAKLKYFFCLLIVVLFVAPVNAAEELDDSGSFSSYLVGKYDLSDSGNTEFVIINPTSQKLVVIARFFDANGSPKTCKNSTLLPNALLAINAGEELSTLKPEVPEKGVIKIVSLDRSANGKPLRGIVGFQRQYMRSKSRFSFWGVSNIITESNLASVPTEVLFINDFEELKRIVTNCP